jgi:16S rRNA pseudouridine516 synthase
MGRAASRLQQAIAPEAASERLQKALAAAGLGSRREMEEWIAEGRVQVNGETVTDSGEFFELDGLHFNVQGTDWPFKDKAYVLLNKPAGTECSQKPSTWPSIYTLLPAPLRQRPQKAAVQGVQAVGRLDQDTTGMLLLTDDGKFIHRMSSPRHHVPKVYEARLKHPITPTMVQKLLDGVVLDDDPKPVRAAACEAVDEHLLRLTLTEGKYHQVKRMVAAVSNRVEALHRSRIGGLELPPDLAPGQWRWLRAADLELLA